MTIFLIVVLDQVRQKTRSGSERCYADNHDEYAEDLLVAIRGEDVSVPYSWKRRDREVNGRQIKLCIVYIFFVLANPS